MNTKTRYDFSLETFFSSANQFYDAFIVANGCQTTKWLWCTWHVDKAWKKELQENISGVEVQADVYKMLRTILEQMDETLFHQYLQIAMDRLKESPQTKMFFKYFEKQWYPYVQHWGYFYRKGDGINTNMFVEAFHRVFKYSYLRGKTKKRVDVCLINLIKFNRDKIFQRLIKLTKGKNTHKLKLIFQRHKASLNLSASSVTKKDDHWLYTHESSTYIITMINELCKEPRCQLRCEDCNICMHIYTCIALIFL